MRWCRSPAGSRQAPSRGGFALQGGQRSAHIPLHVESEAHGGADDFGAVGLVLRGDGVEAGSSFVVYVAGKPDGPRWVKRGCHESRERRTGTP
jgi:hypothetical protein